MEPPAPGGGAPDDPVVDGVPETISQSGSLAQGRAQFLDAIPVTPGTPFRAVISGTGDADLYVRFGARPTGSSYDCRPYEPDASEVCELMVPVGESEAYVAVNGYTATQFTLTVTYTP